jgi:competence protein ComEA
MLKKLLLVLATFILTMGFAFAQVDVNKADQAALDSVKGIGPAKSKAIIEERKKGNFKDWPDLEKRVKGIGEKNSAKMSAAGLTVNGQAKPGAPASKETKKEAKANAKEVKQTKSAESPPTDVKASGKTVKQDAKDAKEGIKSGAKDVKEGVKGMGKNAKADAKELKDDVKDGAKTTKDNMKKDAAAATK